MKLRIAPIALIDDPKLITAKGGPLFPDRTLAMDSLRAQFISDDPDHAQGATGTLEFTLKESGMKEIRRLFDPTKRLLVTIEEVPDDRAQVIAPPAPAGALVPLDPPAEPAKPSEPARASFVPVKRTVPIPFDPDPNIPV